MDGVWNADSLSSSCNKDDATASPYISLRVFVSLWIYWRRQTCLKWFFSSPFTCSNMKELWQLWSFPLPFLSCLWKREQWWNGLQFSLINKNEIKMIVLMQSLLQQPAAVCRITCCSSWLVKQYPPPINICCGCYVSITFSQLLEGMRKFLVNVSQPPKSSSSYLLKLNPDNEPYVKWVNPLLNDLLSRNNREWAARFKQPEMWNCNCIYREESFVLLQ